MASRIEDYALIGDLYTSALVSTQGAIDWLCLPRLDSDACFAALLGTRDHGHWTVWPADPVVRSERRYRKDTLILETTVTTETGSARIVDFMPVRTEGAPPTLIRIVEGVTGEVAMRSTVALRFGYGRIRAFYTSTPAGIHAQAGPDGVLLVAPRPAKWVDKDVVCEFTVAPGQSLALQAIWHRPWERLLPVPVDPHAALGVCEHWWRDWASTAASTGEYREAIVRSLITLKALSYEPTGALAAAATTSLPETLGGHRNWDYRYTWLRDASMTLQALLDEGYRDEAMAFRGWVLRAVAGDPAEMQIMYSITGKRHIPELTLDWLPGYENSPPVRIGNGAADQFQLDVYGELGDAAYLGRVYGLQSKTSPGAAWYLQKLVADFVAERWREPDEGIWEVRGNPQHFTYSKVMAWVAVNRVVRCITEFGLEGDLAHYQALADEIHADICANAIDPQRNCFTQYYGSTTMDASLLMIPLVEFLPPDDPRIVATVHEVERELGHDDMLVYRYLTEETHDGLEGEEGAFLICSFWLVQCLALIGERDRAKVMFDRLLALRNDVGLLAEEYDASLGRMLGNMPQAFSHIGLINAAHAITGRPHRD